MKRIFNATVALILVTLPNLILASQLPVENFSRLPMFERPKLSPSGNQIAYISNIQQEGLAVLTTFNLEKGERHYLVKSDNEKVKINWFNWANDKTLVISARYAGKRGRTDTTETRLLAIEADGSSEEPRQLIKPRSASWQSKHYSQFQDRVIDYLDDDPEHVLIALDLDSPNMPSVYRLNIYNKRLQRIERGKRKIRSWMTDQQGNLRLGHAVDYKSGEAIVYVRNDQESDLRKLFEYNALEEPGVDIAGFDLDPNVLYFKQYKGDKKALYKINLSTNEQELVFEDPDYDVDGSLIYSKTTKAVIGLSHANTETGRIYWDESRSKLINGLNKALPDMDNYLVSFNQDENSYLLYSENDFTPGVYYLGYRKEGQLNLLFEQYPELTYDALTQHNLISYKARDGVEIEGYLSLPKNAEGPFPTIIHPHGGPGARDYDGFDYWTTYFVNRGYAVLRPNFRGSSGYGYEFAMSQMQGWGLQMQDDLEDATKWMIEQGHADAKKVCIVGASYGGYAAAMALTKTPDMYKCAVSLAGVSDLKRLLRTSRQYVGKKFVKKQLGDDYDDLENRSPYFQAKHIKAPILLVHGEDDRIVDVEQSRQFADKLEDLDKEVEYIELTNGDHYLSIQRNRHDFFNAMDKFLSKHLK